MAGEMDRARAARAERPERLAPGLEAEAPRRLELLVEEWEVLENPSDITKEAYEWLAAQRQKV